MKKIQILTIAFLVAFTNMCFAEQETSSAAVKPIQELNIEEILVDNLPKESQVGNLSDLVKDENSVADSLAANIWGSSLLYPFAEGMAYVNGALCHVGNYPHSIVYTILEGPQYGLQTVTAPDGYVLYVNYEYTLEYLPYGVVLHHYYSDSEIITGSTQVISFY